MKKATLVLIALINVLNVWSQTWKWAYSSYDPGTGNALAFDGSGNLFWTANYNLFLQKFNVTGDSLWKKTIGSSDEGAFNMALGPDTSIFLVGNGYMAQNSFVRKFDRNGNPTWSYYNSVGGQYANNVAHSVAVDSYGNCYASGIYDNSATFGACTFSNPGEATFITKLSSSGSCLWSRDIPNGGNYFSDLTLDRNEDLVIGTPDSIVKVSNNQVQWVIIVRELKGQWHPTVSEINTDQNNNIYFVVGGDSVQVGSSVQTTGATHQLLVKVSPLGSVIWMKTIKTPVLPSIFIGNAIYIAGYYDTKLQKYSLNGDSVWTRFLTSDNPSDFHIRNITGSTNDFIAITGQLYGILKDGQDTVLKSKGGPFVAVMEDINSNSGVATNEHTEDGFKVWPNPTSSLIRLHSTNKNSHIEIRNLYGEKIFSADQATNSFIYDFSEKPKGVYFICLVTNNKTQVTKFIVE